MADIDKNPATLLAELAALDPPQRREVARSSAGGGRDVRRRARRSAHRPRAPAAGPHARSELTGANPFPPGCLRRSRRSTAPT